jgi:hypothetical protein
VAEGHGHPLVGGIPRIMWIFHCHVVENETNWTTTFN